MRIQIGKYTCQFRNETYPHNKDGKIKYGIIDVFLEINKTFTEHDMAVLSNYCLREGFFDDCGLVNCVVYNVDGDKLKYNIYSENYE